MSPSVTHDHLNELADRLDVSVRREADLVREQMTRDFRAVHARIGEVNETVKRQNGRIGKAEEVLGAVKETVRVVTHDLRNHLGAHETFTELVKTLRQASDPAAAPNAKPTKAFVAGVIAAVIALAGVGQYALELAVTAIEFMKRIKP